MSSGRKIKLSKKGRRTKWAPFWIIPKSFGKNRKVHPARKTFVKRSWRRTRTRL
ncbi:50S ribosomal protein L39e [Candidatus Woesearchaeota archaeon]|nr:50S ribosomal protein L39e [Candidatus Woesearchaeota archaeon]